MKRRGEKFGWIGGWFGSFIWLGILSAIWLFQNKISEAMTGLAVFIVAIIVISMTAPWKHPNTKYWKLMLPIYSLLFCSIALSIYLYGGLEIIGLKWTSIFWVIPGLIPLVTAGNRTWNSSENEDSSPDKAN
jgi:phosphatidylserine synthase